jgi:hypothetical protein
MSSRTSNVTGDFIPSAPINFECCFEELKEIKFERLQLDVPLENVTSSVHDLRVASIKINEVQEMVKEQEKKRSQNVYMIAATWSSVVGTIGLFILCLCCNCCCCKCCRNSFCWFWNKWTPKQCWRETQERCCVNINNYHNAKLMYTKADVSPAISVKSLPEVGTIVTTQPKPKAGDEITVEKEVKPIVMRTRSRTMFR